MKTLDIRNRWVGSVGSIWGDKLLDAIEHIQIQEVAGKGHSEKPHSGNDHSSIRTDSEYKKDPK